MATTLTRWIGIPRTHPLIPMNSVLTRLRSQVCWRFFGALVKNATSLRNGISFLPNNRTFPEINFIYAFLYLLNNIRWEQICNVEEHLNTKNSEREREREMERWRVESISQNLDSCFRACNVRIGGFFACRSVLSPNCLSTLGIDGWPTSQGLFPQVRTIPPTSHPQGGTHFCDGRQWWLKCHMSECHLQCWRGVKYLSDSFDRITQVCTSIRIRSPGLISLSTTPLQCMIFTSPAESSITCIS